MYRCQRVHGGGAYQSSEYLVTPYEIRLTRGMSLCQLESIYRDRIRRASRDPSGESRAHCTTSSSH